MPVDFTALVRDALSENPPPAPLRAIRRRANVMGRRQAAKWSTAAVALAALLIFACAPVTQTHHSVPAPVPAPQPTIT